MVAKEGFPETDAVMREALDTDNVDIELESKELGEMDALG